MFRNIVVKMAWEQLSINKPHLVYIIMGGFTSIFMLVSLIIKEKLYVGEATVATVVGLIFGPHAANLIDPQTWGNTDQITIEFSRIVLVVQCFAVGVELPKAYMERHWRSVVLLLLPVMTWGWLITSLFMWWMIEPLTWLESLVCAACVTATDPVLASSVVGKGKFAKRVPKHIRDLLSAESGCNDGMAFPFIYLALYLIQYKLNAAQVTYHWICFTILYECIWGAVYGALIGYIARHAIKFADKKKLIDRESFLVFYFVLALFCAGSGSMLGMDDLLVGFAAGVGFSNDGWFQEKTEESHVSNVIDLLLNLTYFVYLGTIIPWDQFNNGVNGIEAWRLVVIAIMVILFRRIPIMLALKSFIPDIKTWREALFCGHFGPIGVGAIFVAILARAELETKTTTPLADPPGPGEAQYVLIYTIWPLTTFLVLSSIVVHGSSVAVFTLGKRINTLTLTLSYTAANDQSSGWMNRLPRISSMGSRGKSYDSRVSDDEGFDEKGNFDASKIPKLQLRRQKEEEYADSDKKNVQTSNRSRSRDKRNKKNYGGPISDSAYGPALTPEAMFTRQESGSDTLDGKSNQASPEREERHSATGTPSMDKSRNDSRSRRGSDETDHSSDKRTGRHRGGVDVEAYQEGDDVVVEDEEGNVIETVSAHGRGRRGIEAIVQDAKNRLSADKTGNFTKHKHEPHPRDEGEEVERNIEDAAAHPERHFRDAFKGWKGFGKRDVEKTEKPERKRGPAHAFQIGNTVVVEDEDGEVIKTFTLPRGEHEQDSTMRRGMQRMGTFVGLNRRDTRAESTAPVSAQKVQELEEESTQDQGQAIREDRPMKRESKSMAGGASDRDRGKGEDDGLRMVISRTEEYGPSGLRKPRPGARPDLISMGGGRRLSTKEFIAQMQQLDRSTRQERMEQAGVGRDIRAEVNRGAQERKAPTRLLSRLSTTQYSKPDGATIREENEEPQDYFSTRPSRVEKKSTVPKDESTNQHQPQGDRTLSIDSQSSKSSDVSSGDDASVPRHDVRSSISRHNQRSGTISAAEARRRSQAGRAQFNSIDERGEGEDEVETAAEAKRRRAALGEEPDDAPSSSEDEGAPRIVKAVQPPSQRSLVTLDEPQRPSAARIQWGNAVRGALREHDDEEAQRGPGPGAHRGRSSMKRRLTNLLNS